MAAVVWAAVEAGTCPAPGCLFLTPVVTAPVLVQMGSKSDEGMGLRNFFFF